MQNTGGPGWRITMDTSGPMLLALYLKDHAGLDGAGMPPVAPVQPRVREADHQQLTQHVGGLPALRREWEAWWQQLIRDHPQTSPSVDPPDFPAFGDAPALQRVLQAHFGAALTWARERLSDYRALERQRADAGAEGILREIVQERQLEAGPEARDFTLTIIELPLNEDRAWLAAADKVIMSQGLLADREAFRSYLRPIVELLV